MQILNNKPAPDFQTTDIYGNALRLADLKGKKVLLSFYRNAGCPICNFRFHELEKEKDFFQQHNLTLVAVYESSVDKMHEYIGSEKVYPIMVADPAQKLYDLYRIGRSTRKMLSGLLFHGGISKMNKGNALYKTKMKQDGNQNRIAADFLIDENGRVVEAHYGSYLGDHISVETLRAFANQ